MKRRSFLLASASATLALPACRSSNNPRPPGGQGPPGGASGSASASASAGASSPTAPPDGVPVAFGKILRSNDVPVHHPILGYSTGYTTCCRFNETVVGGDIHYGFVAAIPHALAAAYVTPTTGKVRVLTVDPKTLEYATVEFNGDVPQPPGTEAPTPVPPSGTR